MPKDFLKDCCKCYFRDTRSGQVPTCLAGYILHGNKGEVVIDCKLTDKELKDSRIKDSDNE